MKPGKDDSAARLFELADRMPPPAPKPRAVVPPRRAVELRQLAERGRAASPRYVPADIPPSERNAYVPPHCVACGGAVVECVRTEVDEQTGRDVVVKTGARDCYHCDEHFERVEPKGWVATGPAKSRVAAAPREGES